jgi:hypothetical protein
MTNESIDTAEDEGTYSTMAVTLLAKTDLFRNIKFLNGDKALEGCSHQTIGAVVVTKLNIKEDEKEAFWEMHKRGVAEGINTRRNDCQTAIKKVVIGKKSNSDGAKPQ